MSEVYKRGIFMKFDSLEAVLLGDEAWACELTMDELSFVGGGYGYGGGSSSGSSSSGGSGGGGSSGGGGFSSGSSGGGGYTATVYDGSTGTSTTVTGSTAAGAAAAGVGLANSPGAASSVASGGNNTFVITPVPPAAPPQVYGAQLVNPVACQADVNAAIAAATGNVLAGGAVAVGLGEGAARTAPGVSNPGQVAAGTRVVTGGGAVVTTGITVLNTIPSAMQASPNCQPK
jgi:hypothetical protein